jgi:RimJ/RimL family protein N-acetyltransferase
MERRMTTFPDISISTERLVLRPFEGADTQALVDMMNDDQVVAWTSAPHPYTEDTAREWATRTAKAERSEGRGIAFAVTEFLTHRLVGVCHLHQTNWHTRSTEISYVIAPWARGEGYAVEVVLAVAEWLFTDQKFERLELRTAPGNTASQQVAQKIGCVSEGVLRSAGMARAQSDNGDWSGLRTDLIVWSLLPEDLDGPHGHPGEGSDYGAFTDWC